MRECSLKVSKNTNWILLLLLIFTGQTLSVPLTNNNDCQMDHSSDMSSIVSMSDHSMDSMSGHDMSMMDLDMDCCADDCQCSDGMCLTTVYFSFSENKNPSFILQNSVIFQVVPFKNSQQFSFIYRPPILS